LRGQEPEPYNPVGGGVRGVDDADAGAGLVAEALDSATAAPDEAADLVRGHQQPEHARAGPPGPPRPRLLPLALLLLHRHPRRL